MKPETWQPLSPTEARFPPVTETLPVTEEEWAIPTMERRPLPRMETAVAEPPVIPSIPTVDKPSEWYEKPKEWFETGSERFGEAVSKVPVLPKALQKIAPAFEFISEKLEKPWASIITAPLSPSLPWQVGENWIEHQRREYETWKAPTYFKGAAEFSMPLWWTPWFTWAKGIRATIKGAKLARGLKAPEALELPSKEVLNAGYKENWFRSLAHWAENKPVISNIVRAIGGEAAFARNIGEVFPAMDLETRKWVVANLGGKVFPVTDVVRREIVNKAILQDMRHGYKGQQLPRLQALAPGGDVAKVLQVDDVGRVMAATPKVGNKLGRGLSEVFEHPNLYTLTPKAELIVKEWNKIMDELIIMGKKEGIDIKKIYHRIVEGVERQLPNDKTIFEASEYGSRFEKARHFNTMEEGITAYATKGQKLIYGRDPLKSLSATIDYYFKKIATKRFDDEVGKLGLTIPEMVSLVEPGLVEKLAELGTRAGSTSYLIKTLKTLKLYKGDSIPGAVGSKIRRGMPEAMERIEQAFSISPPEAQKLMDTLAKTIQRETRINAISLKIMMGQFNRQSGKILAREIDDLVHSLNLTNATAARATRQAYKAAYQSRKQFVDDTLKSVREEAETLLKSTKSELAPLKQQYRYLAQPYKEATGQIFGDLAKFRTHSAFRNRIFDADVVKLAESTMGKQGSEWMRSMAQVSGVGRLLVAALDFSAPFIQGLAALGRNPVAWADGVMKQFRFFVKPDDFFRYMTQPHIRALAAERWAHGGSRSTFEFFEALAPAQRAAEKVPKVGERLKGIIRETYGRAEVAFSGFGEATRNNMWEALRVKALRPDGTLDVAIGRELARSIDRMTGVMSTEAIAIPRNQIDFENAWVFFAPRYTRAGMSYVADLMRGGIAGAEARKGLGALMAAGMTYYIGASRALGQQPNLDINSPRFMTVKIGDDYVGVGGILYSLARLGANVVGTAIEEPVSFTTLNRFDNPFVKFMFSRSSVLTGMTFGAVIEHKNFFGEPLESVGDWGKFLAEKALPIAMQRAILEPEHRNPAVFTSELMGGRTFPKSAWELQEEMKDRLAMTERGLPYDQLDLLQKRRIDQHPEVTKFQEEIDEQITRRGKALSVEFLERRRDLDDARFMHKESIENLQRAYDAGMINGFDFKEGVKSANYGYGATYEHINRNPRYAEAMKKLKEPKEVNREYRWELAFDELMNASSSNMFEDEFGIFNFEKYNEFVNSLRVKYGDADFNRALEFQREKYAEYPPLFQEWLKAKEVLKPYWEVRNKVEKMFGKTYAESTYGQRLINRERERMRRFNPELERYRQLFYVQK